MNLSYRGGKQLHPDFLVPYSEAPPGGWWWLTAQLSPLVSPGEPSRAGPVLSRAPVNWVGSTVDGWLYWDSSHLAWRQFSAAWHLLEALRSGKSGTPRGAVCKPESKVHLGRMPLSPLGGASSHSPRPRPGMGLPTGTCWVNHPGLRQIQPQTFIRTRSSLLGVSLGWPMGQRVAFPGQRSKV